MARSSSFHRLNADLGLNRLQQRLWVWLNRINNGYFPNSSRGLAIRGFNPQPTEDDWTKIHPLASPSRALSDLFWLKLDWEAIRAELGAIHVFDTGAGNGGYALKLAEFSGGVDSYCGADRAAAENWPELTREHPFITMLQADADSIGALIPERSNFFISQSAIEHFENDLSYFEEIRRFIARGGNNTVQAHLFPSSACLRLYGHHGVRQYTPRTCAKIVRLFVGPEAYAILFNLGGERCSDLHFRYITRPAFMPGRQDWRETKPVEYRKLLKEAVEVDCARETRRPNFYALIIHSNFKRRIFETMPGLTNSPD